MRNYYHAWKPVVDILYTRELEVLLKVINVVALYISVLYLMNYKLRFYKNNILTRH